MSTRCVVEIVDTDGDFPVRLYHHQNGYPSFMLLKIEKFVVGSYEYLGGIGIPEWSNDPSQVAAMWVVLSMQDYENPIVPCVHTLLQDKNKRLDEKSPRFRPIIDIPVDIEFLYKIFLLGQGDVDIEVYKTKYSENSNRLRRTLIMNPEEVRIWLKNQKKEK